MLSTSLHWAHPPNGAFARIFDKSEPKSGSADICLLWLRQRSRQGQYSRRVSTAKKGSVSDVRLLIRGTPHFSSRVSPRVPSRQSKIAVKLEDSNNEHTDTHEGWQLPSRAEALRRLRRSIPTSGARTIWSISQLLARGGGALRRSQGNPQPSP